MGAEVPEVYGGMGLDKKSTAVLTDAFGGGSSFAVTVGAQTGIGTLPIVYYGNQEQKSKYLPELAAGTKMSAYCLTEPGAGSDAHWRLPHQGCLERGRQALRLKRREDFHHQRRGRRSVHRVRQDRRQGFLRLHRGADFGVVTGSEEEKLGIRGSSTTPVVLEDVKVPVENLLYEPGKGHHIAMNVLNIGRYKLGCFSVGACKAVLKMAVDYALARQQFGRPIADFGMIRKSWPRWP